MKVCELLSGPEKWTQGVPAMDAAGDLVLPTDPRACCWCLRGAIERCYKPEWCQAVEAAYIRELYGSSKRKLVECLSVWNDSPQRTFADVRKLLVKVGK